MAPKSFPKSIQAAAAKALPLWQYVPENSRGYMQQFVRTMGDASSPFKQMIYFQNASDGTNFYVNYWTMYSSVAKGGALRHYTSEGGSRINVDLNGEFVEKRLEENADLIQSTADDYAKVAMADFEVIHRLMSAVMTEYTAWRHNMPSELYDYKTFLTSERSFKAVTGVVARDKQQEDSFLDSRGGLWVSFRKWSSERDPAVARLADYFAATPAAEHQMVPYPDRFIDDARFWDFCQFLRKRGYLKDEKAGTYLRHFWWEGRPRLKNDFGEDKYMGNECFVCGKSKSRGKFEEKIDTTFGSYVEFVCSKCLKK